MADYLQLRRRLRRHFSIPRRQLRDYHDPFLRYSDAEFRRRYRFTKLAVREALLPLVQDIAYPTSRNAAASPLEQLLVFLRYLATDSYHIVSGDLSTVTERHESSVSRYIHKIAQAIAGRASNFIWLPTASEVPQIQQEYYHNYGFPGVSGCIDGVHIVIPNPGGTDSELYRNRKNVFSINCQVVGDFNLCVRDIVCRWFGSAHDARMFENSSVKFQYENSAINGLLLGDSGYPLKRYLITPFLRPSSQCEQRFNRAHARARNSIERLFGCWKQRFPCLKKGLRFSPERSCVVIVAAAVLHNIARGLSEPDFEEVFGLEPESEECDHQNSATPTGLAARNNIVRNYFT